MYHFPVGSWYTPPMTEPRLWYYLEKLGRPGSQDVKEGIQCEYSIVDGGRDMDVLDLRIGYVVL